MSESAASVMGATAAGHHGGVGAEIVLSQATLGIAWNVQGDPVRAGVVADVQRLFGIALPLAPNTTTRNEALLALWLGPRSWLLVGAPARAGEGGDFATASDTGGFTATGDIRGFAATSDVRGFAAHRDALNQGHGAVFDVSASRVAYTVRGPHAGTLLARTCPLDFDARAFAAGHCAQSVLGRMSALYYRHRRSQAFTVMVARSFAVAAWHALCVAAATGGYDVEEPAPLGAD